MNDSHHMKYTAAHLLAHRAEQSSRSGVFEPGLLIDCADVIEDLANDCKVVEGQPFEIPMALPLQLDYDGISTLVDELRRAKHMNNAGLDQVIAASRLLRVLAEHARQIYSRPVLGYDGLGNLVDRPAVNN
jgi:hypothetical protein